MGIYDRADEIVDLIKGLDDKGIDAVITVAKEQGMKFDADYLKFTFKVIRNT